MRYQENIIRSVVEATDLVELISQYMTLKKSGRTFMGCCPFHNEKTPSFSVSQEKQVYHCFGCGESGNVISFVEKIENMRFPEALEFLADRAGITLPKDINPQEELQYQKKQRLMEMHRQAANHYFRLLTKNKAAQRYLANRGYNRDTIRNFGLGVSSGEWQDLVSFLTAAHFSEAEMLESGLILRGKNGRLYDRFRNRLMIPIQNIRDKIIGFGGRNYLEDGNAGPKYINSPETLIFSKGFELFNLNRAKKFIEHEQLIIVEGYMDVIALHQHGIKNVTASLGTAFTPYHAKLLSRYAKEAVLCFDGDAAGEKATQKAIDILEKSPMAVRILRLDEKEDPDSYIQKNSPDVFKAAVAKAMTVTDYQLKMLARQYDLSHSDGKVKFLSGAVDCIKKCSHSLEKEMYVRKAAGIAGVSPNLLFKEVSRCVTGEEIVDFSGVVADSGHRIPKDYRDAQEVVLKELLEKDKFETELKSGDFSPGIYRKLFELIQENDSMRDPAVMMAALTENNERSVFSSLILGRRAINAQILEESIQVIKKYGQTRRNKAVIQKIRINHTDEQDRLKQLDALTKSMKISEEGL